MEREGPRIRRGVGTGDRAELVPRFAGQGYAREQVAERRAWVESETGASLEHVGAYSIPSEEMRGNVENPVGACQVPLGVAGPLEVVGEHAHGRFYVPLATTEGALVRSYERGMVALTRAGGATARISLDRNRICPIFCFPDVASAHAGGGRDRRAHRGARDRPPRRPPATAGWSRSSAGRSGGT